MTKRELKQYRSLKAEIDDLEITIKEHTYRDTVQGSDSNYPFCKRAMSVSGLPPKENKTLERLNKLRMQRDKIYNFVESTPDSLTRRILRIKYIYGDTETTWNEVADSLGGNNTEGSVRKIIERYLNNAEHNKSRPI